MSEVKKIRDLFNLDKTEDDFQEVGVTTYLPEETTAKFLVPVKDEGYYFDPDILKAVFLGYSKNMPTYLYGHAGTGKTTFFEQFCARLGVPFVRIQHSANTEESHIVGQMGVDVEIDNNGNKVNKTSFKLGLLPQAMMYGFVYCADEYDFASPTILSVYQAVLEGKPLVIKEADEKNRIIYPHKNFRFVATGNTNGSGDETGLYQGTNIQNSANLERFGIMKKVNYMPKYAEELIIKKIKGVVIAKEKLNDASLSLREKNSVEKIVKTFSQILDFVEKTRLKLDEGEISFAASTRVLLNIVEIFCLTRDPFLAIQLCYSNRLPESEKIAIDNIAQAVICKK